MRQASALILLFIGALPLLAQVRAPQKVDKVLLTNGSVLYGWVTRAYHDSTFIIDIDPDTQIQLSIANVEKVKYNRPNPQLIYRQRDKFFHRFEGGVLLGRTNEWAELHTDFTFQTMHGFQFTDLWGIGFGIGYDRYGSSQHLPLYIGISGEAIHGRWSPYYFINTGLSKAWDYSDQTNFLEVIDVDGGFMLQAGAGLKLNLYHHSLLLSISYKQQRSHLIMKSNGGFNEVLFDENRNNKRISITTGISF